MLADVQVEGSVLKFRQNPHSYFTFQNILAEGK